jgi:hypothetical protein
MEQLDDGLVFRLVADHVRVWQLADPLDDARPDGLAAVRPGRRAEVVELVALVPPQGRLAQRALADLLHALQVAGFRLLAVPPELVRKTALPVPGARDPAYEPGWALLPLDG